MIGRGFGQRMATRQADLVLQGRTGAREERGKGGGEDLDGTSCVAARETQRTGSGEMGRGEREER